MAAENWVEEVLDFWFGELGPDDWYSGDGELDAKIRERFGDLHDRLSIAVPAQVVADARTALGAVIVLDQFPRNMFRGRPEAFATDDLAISVSRKALDAEFDAGMTNDEKSFLYMPFMHSEILADQERCVNLFRSLENENGLKYAIDHRDIIAEYGRFPHRNRILGRQSSRAELEFLDRHEGFGQ